MCSSFACCSPKGVAKVLLRVSFGLSLMFVGVTHLRDLGSLIGLSTSGLPPALSQMALVWSYLLPALMIVGGLIYIAGMWMYAGSILAGLALASIPAGMLLKSALGDVELSQTMPAAINAWIWLLVYFFVTRSSCGGGMGCGSGCGGCAPTSGCCGAGSCASCDMPKSEPVKAAVVAPKVVAKKPMPPKKKA